MVKLSEFDLDSFLESRQSEGVSMGEGGFTISHDKARQKMAQYSLPREEAWVLKLVQAAVDWNGTRLEIVQTHRETTFKFFFDDHSSLPTIPELVSAIVQANLEQATSLEHFAIVLRRLVETSHLSFLMHIDCNDGDAQSLYAGVHFSDMGEEQRKKERQEWGAGITLKIYQIPHTDKNRLLYRYIPLEHYVQDFRRELSTYAYFSPLTLIWGLDTLPGLMTSRMIGWDYTLKPLRTRGIVPPDSDEVPYLKIPDGLGDACFTVYQEPSDYEIEPCQAKIFFLLALEGPKLLYNTVSLANKVNLHWMKDGVVMDTETLTIESRHLHLHIFAPSDGLDTDLTGFQLILNDRMLERRRWVLSSVARALQEELDAGRDVLGPAPEPVVEEKVVSDYSARSPIVNELIGMLKMAGTKVAEIIDNFFDPRVDWRSNETQLQYNVELERMGRTLASEKFLSRRPGELEVLKKILDYPGYPEIAELSDDETSPELSDDETSPEFSDSEPSSKS